MQVSPRYRQTALVLAALAWVRPSHAKDAGAANATASANATDPAAPAEQPEQAGQPEQGEPAEQAEPTEPAPAGQADPPPAPVEAPPPPPAQDLLVPDHEIARPVPQTRSFSGDPVEPREVTAPYPPRAADGREANPTRLETMDGVVVLSNRQPPPRGAANSDLAKTQGDAPQKDSPAAGTEEDEDVAWGIAADRLGSGGSKRSTATERDAPSGGLGWLWALLGVAGLLLVPIGLLLNRGARRTVPPGRSSPPSATSPTVQPHRSSPPPSTGSTGPKSSGRPRP
jgi:hypothetical protein